MFSMINEKMKQILKSKKVSQIDASKMLGVEVGRLNHWLIGRRQPSIESIKKFCEVFDTTPNYLMGFEDDISDQDRAILKAVKSVAGIQKQAENDPDTSKQVQVSAPER